MCVKCFHFRKCLTVKSWSFMTGNTNSQQILSLQSPTNHESMSLGLYIGFRAIKRKYLHMLVCPYLHVCVCVCNLCVQSEEQWLTLISASCWISLRASWAPSRQTAPGQCDPVLGRFYSPRRPLATSVWRWENKIIIIKRKTPPPGSASEDTLCDFYCLYHFDGEECVLWNATWF